MAIATTETSLASLATTFPAGDNYIIVTVAISTVPQGSASTIDIAGGSPGNLKLKRGASVLSSNEFVCRVGGTTPDASHFPTNYCYLLYKDVGAPFSPSCYSDIVSDTMNTMDYQIQGNTRRCAVTGKELQPGDKVFRPLS